MSELDCGSPARLVILPSISSISLCQIPQVTQGANCRGVGGGTRGNRNDGLLGWEASQHFFAGLEEEKIKEKKCFLIGLFPWKKLIFFSKKKLSKDFFY